MITIVWRILNGDAHNGQSVAEATIIKCLKTKATMLPTNGWKLSDKVVLNATPQGGVLVKRLFNEGDVVQVGAVIAHISTGAAASSATAPVAATPVVAKPEPVKQAEIIETASVSANNNFSDSSKFYSPLVKNIAKQEGISVAELDSIKGTGAEGRVTKQDILAYIPNKGNKMLCASPSQNGAQNNSASIAKQRFRLWLATK